MSKKASAFQVYSEDQVHQRQARSYRNPQVGSYKSPPAAQRGTSTRTSRDWGDDVDTHPARRSLSPVDRYTNRSYKTYNDYDTQRIESSSYSRDSRYEDNVRKNSSSDLTQARYRTDDQYDRRSWERDDVNRHDDYPAPRDRGASRRQDDYLIVDTRDTAPKAVRGSTQYSDSDEECLHESLRRKKQGSQQFSDHDDQRRWSSDDDYENYRQTRKRMLSDEDYHSPSPPPAKVWREEQPYSSEDDRPDHYADYPTESDKGQMVAPAPALKKKKAKGPKKPKNKKQKAASLTPNPAVTGKIQSLMDVQIPSSVKKQVEQGNAAGLPRFGDSRSEFRFSQGSEDSSRRTTSRDDRSHSKYDSSNKTRSRYDDDHDDDRYSSRNRDQVFRREDTNADRKRNPPHRDSYSSRQRSPEYDRRNYRHSDDEYDRQRRTSFTRDGRNGTDVSGAKRKRQGSIDRRDWQRRHSQKDRSPDYRAYSDSDQDSDREGRRRSWRDERRDRNPKKDEEKDRAQKGGDKKAKGNMEDTKEVRNTPVETVTVAPPPPPPAVEKHVDESTKMKVVPCTDGLAVLFTHPQDICIRGRAKVRVVAGEMSVMGHIMSAERPQTYDLFSPSTSSLLTLTSCSAQKDKKVLRKAGRSLGLEDEVMKEFPTGAVIFLATELDYPAADYICSHPPFTQIFRYYFDKVTPTQTPAADAPPDPTRIGAAFLSSDQASTVHLKMSDDYEEALKKWNSAIDSNVAPIAVLCGGVNSGKSTMSRYMVNSALNRVPRVCYFNCDVGQTEFSPPGTVSLTIIDKPMFGPPFCHQRTSLSMVFYGLVSPADGPSRYVQCLQHVFQVYQDMPSPPPLVVNTMGWNQGLGLKLFVDVLTLTSPDLVIQINLHTPIYNFPAITHLYPALNSGWLFNSDPVAEDDEEALSKRKKHELIVLKSLVNTRNDNTRIKLTPKDTRDLALLSHLMQGYDPSVTLTTAAPYVMPWNKFAVHVCHSLVPRRLVVHTLNAAIVALCRADLSEAVRVSEDLPLFFDEAPICECLGYGLVRAVDHKKQLMYVVTPLPPHRLAKVNTLLRGSINIPDQLFLKQRHPEDVPYIDALEPATGLAPVRPRARMPRHN